MNQCPVIDYDTHPAFAGLAARDQDRIADDIIQEIEAAYARLCDEIATPEARIAAFERDIAPKIDALLQHILQNPPPVRISTLYQQCLHESASEPSGLSHGSHARPTAAQ